MPSRQRHGQKGKRIYDRETIDPLTIARLDLFSRTFTLKWIMNEGAAEPALLLGVEPPLTFMDMVSLSENDLDNVQRLFQLAIDTARPVIQTLDASANRMWEEGTAIPRRLYRAPPNFVYFGTPKPDMPPQTLPQPEGEDHADTGEPSSVPGEPGA